MLTRAELVAIVAVSSLAMAILIAYVGDTFGLALHAYTILILSLAGAVSMSTSFDWRLSTRALAQDTSFDSRSSKDDVAAIVTIVTVVFAWLLWLAWPHMLPVGQGPDLTHHLLLVDYIDRARHLVHDRALAPFLGEMTDYTPGMHLLAVMLGSWMHADGLHAVYRLVAFSVALKVGVIFLIALRCQPAHGPYRLPMACAAALLLFLPQQYVLGSFTHDSYLSQVVSELFAVTMWWAIVCWDQQPSIGLAAVFALAGVAAFLTWPVWTGPMIVTLVVVASLHREQARSDRLRHVLLAVVPIGLIGAAYFIGRIGGASAMAATAGAVLVPSLANVGWLFLSLGIVGAVVAATDRRARTIPMLLAAIGLQAAALAYVARAATAPYLALKMVYLAVYPLAIGGAVALGAIVRMASRRSPVSNERKTGRTPFSRVAWLVPLALLIPIGRMVLATSRPTPVISDSLYDAGRWAREHVPSACVDYLTTDDDSAYWLHLAVLGNPRAAGRSLSSDTFDPQRALVRWIFPGGLPYAIAERFDALPKDIRENVDVLARFGATAVVKRRGPSSCRTP